VKPLHENILDKEIEEENINENQDDDNDDDDDNDEKKRKEDKLNEGLFPLSSFDATNATTDSMANNDDQSLNAISSLHAPSSFESSSSSLRILPPKSLSGYSNARRSTHRKTHKETYENPPIEYDSNLDLDSNGQLLEIGTVQDVPKISSVVSDTSNQASFTTSSDSNGNVSKALLLEKTNIEKNPNLALQSNTEKSKGSPRRTRNPLVRIANEITSKGKSKKELTVGNLDSSLEAKKNGNDPEVSEGENHYDSGDIENHSLAKIMKKGPAIYEMDSMEEITLGDNSPVSIRSVKLSSSRQSTDQERGYSFPYKQRTNDIFMSDSKTESTNTSGLELLDRNVKPDRFNHSLMSDSRVSKGSSENNKSKHSKSSNPIQPISSTGNSIVNDSGKKHKRFKESDADILPVQPKKRFKKLLNKSSTESFNSSSSDKDFGEADIKENVTETHDSHRMFSGSDSVESDHFSNSDDDIRNQATQSFKPKHHGQYLMTSQASPNEKLLSPSTRESVLDSRPSSSSNRIKFQVGNTEENYPQRKLNQTNILLNNGGELKVPSGKAPNTKVSSARFKGISTPISTSFPKSPYSLMYHK